MSLAQAFIYVIPHTGRFHYDLSITACMKIIEEFVHFYQVIVYPRIVQYLSLFVNNGYLQIVLVNILLNTLPSDLDLHSLFTYS